MIQLRHYSRTKQEWAWDSRYDGWYVRSMTEVSPRLEYRTDDEPVWSPVPTVNEVIGPGPKPQD